MASAAFQRRPDSLQPGDILVVVHDFDARSPDELTLRKAERVELVELDEGFGDGWFLGRHLSRDATGLFPGVYTAKLPANIAALHSTAGHPYAHSTQQRPPTVPASSPEPAPAPYQHYSDPTPAEADHSAESPNYYTQASSFGASRMPASTTQPSYKPIVQRSIGEALGSGNSGEDSPVMNETLSVIDEHITDLSTPRQSLAPPQRHEDSSSEYSSHLDRHSFLAGPETDDDDNDGLTREEVAQWDHKQTANHLRSLGVDPKHCDIFEEQEISGDVLLDMDQSFIQMKEFDFGVMGRRLKTWHRIRDFQDEVRGKKASRQTSLNPPTTLEDSNPAQTRTLSGSSILPRIPSVNERPGLATRQSQHGRPQPAVDELPSPLQPQALANGLARTSMGNHTSPSAWRSTLGPDSPSRLSSAHSHKKSHSRRHSSMDFHKQSEASASGGSLGSTLSPHTKQPSLDRGWTPDGGTSSTSITAPSIQTNTIRKQESLEMSTTSPMFAESPNLDLDRGYFSGNEVDNRKARNVLRKREGSSSPGHSRQSSLLEERRTNPAVKRHSRLSSVDSIRELGPSMLSPAAKAYHSMTYKGRFRSASARMTTSRSSTGGFSPTVTNLENEATLNQLPSPGAGNPNSLKMNTIPTKALKLIGLRTISDAVTSSEKETATFPREPVMPETLQESPAASPAGSHTPSATENSFEIDNADAASKSTDAASSMLAPKSSLRPRPTKTKHQTSAYAKGLLKITPDEARQQCDHSGWMKKKSSSLVTMWKSRLFILRGRRLSYYYSENDTEERGIIDISGHKVLVANNDPMITMHATLTGAKRSPYPQSSGGSSAEPSPTLAKTPNSNASGGPFYFKLVPPKAGASRAVQFTRPTIHYFQCENVKEGRKWMGEIMKATIMHDLSSFETTNKQKTISLKIAQRRKERPPALKGTEIEEEKPVVPEKDVGQEVKGRESGLRISGLDVDGLDDDLKLALMAQEETGADDEKEVDKENQAAGNT